MARTPFHFTAQPALDRMVSRRKAAEEALVSALKLLDTEKAGLRPLKDKLFKLSQRALAARENLADRPKGNLIDADEIDALRGELRILNNQIKRQSEDVAAKQSLVERASERVRARRRELEEALAGVRVLESMRDARLRQYASLVSHAQQRQEDDEAINHWLRANGGGER